MTPIFFVLFLFHSMYGTIFLLCYVDDIILTGSNTSFLSSFIHQIISEFAMKDLGSSHYFLGIEMSNSPHDMHLSQE